MQKDFDEFNEIADKFEADLDKALIAFKEINEQIKEIKKFWRINNE